MWSRLLRDSVLSTPLLPQSCQFTPASISMITSILQKDLHWRRTSCRRHHCILSESLDVPSILNDYRVLVQELLPLFISKVVNASGTHSSHATLREQSLCGCCVVGPSIFPICICRCSSGTVASGAPNINTCVFTHKVFSRRGMELRLFELEGRFPGDSFDLLHLTDLTVV